MKILKLSLVLLFLSQLTACAVMSKSQCLDANWQDVGFDVGFDGQRDITTAYNRRADACAKHGTKANWLAFKDGHADGIEQYCQVPNAVELGIRGQSRAVKDQVCPERDYPGFSEAFHAGYKLHELNSIADDSEYELDRLEQELYRVRHKRSDLKRRIQSGELSQQQIERADYKRKRLRRDLRAIQSDLYACRDRLSRYRARAQSYRDVLELKYSDTLY